MGKERTWVDQFVLISFRECFFQDANPFLVNPSGLSQGFTFEPSPTPGDCGALCPGRWVEGSESTLVPKRRWLVMLGHPGSCTALFFPKQVYL